MLFDFNFYLTRFFFLLVIIVPARAKRESSIKITRNIISPLLPVCVYLSKKSLFKKTRIFGADVGNGLHGRGRIKRKAEPKLELGQALPVVRMKGCIRYCVYPA